MYLYQNLTSYPQIINNVGIVSANGTIESAFELNNPNLKLITNQTPAAVEPPVSLSQSVQVDPEPQTEGEK